MERRSNMIVKAHKSDQFAVELAQKIRQLGYQVRVIEDGESAYPGEVAIFSVSNGDVRFPGKHGRLAAHRLFEAGVVPDWASSTPFVAAFRVHPNPKIRPSIKECLKQFTLAYQEWFAGVRDCACPWGCEPTGSDAKLAFERWRRSAAEALLAGRQENAHRLLSYFTPLNSHSLREAAKRMEDGCQQAVSALCLHTDEARSGIVSSLNPQVVKAVKELLEFLPFEEIKIFSFSPHDEILKEWGMEAVVISSVWGNKEALEKHWQLCQELAGPKVKIAPLGELFQDDDLVQSAWKTAYSRAGRMHQRLRKNPPPIFRTLTPKQQKERLAAEAVLYLLMTAQYYDSIYLGFEVHAEYWRSGELYRWKDAFLPVVFAPHCLRQHWADWAIDQKREEEISRLGLI